MIRLSYYVLFCTSSFFLLYACTKSSSSTSTLVGNWLNRFDADFSSRTEAASFTIDDTAYVGTGFDGTSRLNDLWKLTVNGTSFHWTQVASMPVSAARSNAVAFGANKKGYIATGLAADGATRLNDTWQFDPATNSWTQKANFGGTARYDAVAFSVNDKGYITTGYDGNYTKDFWVYDPVADTWTQKAGFSGFKRKQAVAFVYKNKAYVCTGVDNTIYPNDFWSYDPAADAWTQLKSIANVSTDTYDDLYKIIRANAVAFVMGDKAYVCTGESGSLFNDVWEYNFSNDTWAQKTNFEAGTRTGAIGFSIQQRGFISSGNVSSQEYSDFWEFHPSETYNVND